MDGSKHYRLEKGTDFRGFHTSVEQGQWYEDEFLLLSSLTQDRYFGGCVVQKKTENATEHVEHGLVGIGYGFAHPLPKISSVPRWGLAFIPLCISVLPKYNETWGYGQNTKGLS